MQSVTSQSLELYKVVHQVAVLLFRVGGHVMELPDVPLPDAQSEDLNTSLPQSCRHWPRVSTVRVTIGDEENDLGGVSTGLTKNLLQDRERFIYWWEELIKSTLLLFIKQ